MKTYKSKIDPSLSFNSERWVISILNTDGKWFGLPGHSVIVVEGVGLEIENQNKKRNRIYRENIKYSSSSAEPFVRVCDIHAESFPNEKSGVFGLGNSKGYMSDIRIYDTIRKDYPDKTSKSFYATTPEKVVAMLVSILKDAETVQLEKDKPTKTLLFQKWGKHSIFTNSKNGDSCAGWCLEKLAIANIGDGTDKPKPKLMVSSCVLV